MTDTLKIDPHETLYVTDAELIRRTGVPEKIMRQALRELDAKRTGFPPKDPFFGNRRYWPAVKAYLDQQSQRKIAAPQQRERTYASGRR